MASIEYIKTRIEGKKNEITKLTKKIERIEKAQASNWENNPYYYNERDLFYANKELTAAQNALADWENKLASEIEKDNSRNVVAIIEFLNQWAERVFEWYVKGFANYQVAYAEHLMDVAKYIDGGCVKREYIKEYREAKNEFNQTWNFLYPYIDRQKFDSQKLRKELEQDKNAKYDDIIERTNAVVGTITDATNLRVGEKGELNGFIIGERGTAKVETIGAGGYNIQCFHFRTLIHKVR